MCAKAKDHNVQTMHVNINVCKGKGTITLKKCMLKSMFLKAKALKANTVKADSGTTFPLSCFSLELSYVNFFAQSYAHVHIGDRLPKPSLKQEANIDVCKGKGP